MFAYIVGNIICRMSSCAGLQHLLVCFMTNISTVNLICIQKSKHIGFIYSLLVKAQRYEG